MDKPLVTNRALLDAALEGLTATPKTLQPKWFYDAIGSDLFEQITELPEYYPTRTELALLQERMNEIAAALPDGATLVELGSGASTKTRLLLDQVSAIDAYVPVDISADFLHETARVIAGDFPHLEIAPVAGDFMAPLDLPEPLDAKPKVGFFPGSTIGNLDQADAATLLARVREWNNVSAFILGADLVKDRGTLVAAYDDAAGVTAAFNRNVLARLNREAGADFDLDAFDHEARWNDDEARIEMHLVAREPQEVMLGDRTIRFAAGESIHTENSHKYTRERLEKLAGEGGWRVSQFLTDREGLFSINVLTPA